MSCSEVMYQAYYPYLYQRPSTSPVSRPPAFPPFPQYDRFGMQPRSSLEQSQSPVGAGPGDVFISPGGGGSVSSAGSPSSPASLHATPSSSHSKESSSKASAPAAPSEDPGDDEGESGGVEGEGRAGAAQYVSANCVVFTHYSGDAAAVVDEHFSRALSQTSSAAAPTSASAGSSGSSSSAAGGFAGTEPGSGKAAGASKEATSPMSARNFPPSFWNSDYQQHQSMSTPSTSHHHHHDLYSSAAAAAVAAAAAASGTDPYHHHHHVHHHQATSADPWHYHQPAYRAAVHDFTAYNNMAAAAAGRFTSASQYGPLLLAPTASAHPPPPPPPPPPSAPVRPPARHQYLSSSKGAEWTSRLHELETAAPGSTHPLVDGPSHASHSSSYVAAHAAYGSMAGLEGQVQEPSKDLYWF